MERRGVLLIPDAIVIGGGCAGLAAATALAEDGATVRVLEARGAPGGRARSRIDPGSGDVEDNGQHILMGCYDEFLGFLRRTGGIEEVEFQERLEVVLLEPDGAATRFRPGLLPAPVDLLWGLLRVRGFGLWDLPGTIGLAAEARASDALEGRSVREWLTGHAQSQRAQRVFWDPLVLASLNLDPAEASAALFAEVLRRALLAGRGGAPIGFARRGLSPLLADPALRYLRERGGEIAVRAPVAGLEIDTRGRFAAARMRDGSRLAAGAAVLATAHHEAPRLLPEGIASFGREDAEGLGASSIVAVHLWFDRAVAAHPFAGLVDSPVHWIFDRGRVGGARAPGYLALVTSAADGLLRMDRAELGRRAVAEVRRFLPRARAAEVNRVRVLKERRATPRFRPGTAGLRPGPETAAPNLALAGDWTATGLPATLEGAAASGHRAARLLAGRAARDARESGAHPAR